MNKKLVQNFIFSSSVLIAGLAFLASPGVRAAEQEAIVSLQETGRAFAQIAKDVSPAVVNIQSEILPTANQQQDMMDPYGMMPFPMQPQGPSQRMYGQGSGFIISEDGYIVTNNHVVENASKITVKLLNNKEYVAKVIGTDPQTDVAVIKIDAKDLPTVKLGNSDKVQVGEWVVAMGNPFGLSHSVSAGIISAIGRTSMGIADYESFIQTDAAINVGNSGGPLIDLEGNVIGINTAILSRTGGYIGIGFAIPINMANTVIQQLIKSGSVIRGYLGVKIQSLTTELAESFDLKDKSGILVAEAMPDSPAAKAGLKQGDVIVTLDGKAIKDIGEFRNNVANFAPQSKHKLEILRNGKSMSLPITIGSMDTATTLAVAGAPEDQMQNISKLGISVQNITADIAGKIGAEAGVGVVISEVQPDSIMQLARLNRGMVILEVNGQKVNTTAEFIAAVEKAKNIIRLLMQYQQNTWYVAFNLG